MLIGGATISPGTSFAPPSRRTRFTLRSWNASSSGRWPTLMIAVFGRRSASFSISMVWLSGSSAEVASSITTMSGLCRNSRAKARRCCSPPESVRSHCASSSSSFSMRCSRPTISSVSAISLSSKSSGGARIGGGAAQGAERDVGLLRHQEHFRARRAARSRLRPTATARRSRAPACSCRCRIRPRPAPSRRTAP